MPVLFFYLFAAVAVISACAMIVAKNPVTSALCMVGSFIGMAALFVGLNAYFVGIIQILVYAGAIMVLFIFIIMLLDLKAEEKRVIKPASIAAAAIVPGVLLLQILGVLLGSDFGDQSTTFQKPLDLEAAALAHQEASTEAYKESNELADDAEFAQSDIPKSKIQANLEDSQLPDVHLIGRTVFAGRADGGSTSNNLPLQIMGVLLLVATIGVVVLSKKNNDLRTN